MPEQVADLRILGAPQRQVNEIAAVPAEIANNSPY
jgi:hypothetical protein